MSKPGDDNGAPLKQVESYQWPSGHIGHLSEVQQSALERFKKLSQEKGYYIPSGEDATSPPSHDDETMLRYLRARKFVPEQAFGQFKSTEDWRVEHNIDQLYETIDVDEYEQSRRLYPQWTGRRDKRGVPLYVYEVHKVDNKALTAYENDKDTKKSSAPVTSKTPRKMLRLFALYENLVRFVLPLCSALPDRPHGETPMSQSSNIVDISGVGLTKFWSLRNHMSSASELATAYYPETLDRIFVVGAPSFFPTIWQWAQKWFDPITVSKIFILSSKNMKTTLAEYCDMDNVPKKYGGNLEWEFGDMPALDDGIVKSLRWKERTEEKGHLTLPIGPLKWQYDEDGDLVATAVGTLDGKPRQQVIAGLHPEAGIARLALSPGRSDKSTIFVNMSGASASKSPATKEAEAAAPTNPANGNPDGYAEASEGPHVSTSSRAGTSTVPFHDGPSTSQPSREGTSETRFKQQDGTHAEGQLAHATPEVTVDGQGTTTAVMEPGTVGQAPKEHPVPEGSSQPGLVERAQEIAATAYEHVAHVPELVKSAIGMDNSKGKEPTPEPAKEDPAVDNLEHHIVEEFLRSKTMSHAQPSSTSEVNTTQ